MQIEFTKAKGKEGSFTEYESTNQKIYIPLGLLRECAFEQEPGCWSIQHFTNHDKTFWRVIENPMEKLSLAEEN